MKSILKVLFPVLVLLQCGTVSADNFWVLGSYQNEATAEKRATFLAQELAVALQQQSIELKGVTYHRLLARESRFDAEASERLGELGIKPWLITLSEDAVSSDVEKSVVPSSGFSSQYQMFLVGAFQDIDQALDLERRLSVSGIPVRGEARLVGGQVMHNVWVGPTNEVTQLNAQMEALNLTILATRSATSQEAASEIRASRTEALPQQAPAEMATPQSDRFPKNFNLARLPEKRSSQPIVP